MRSVMRAAALLTVVALGSGLAAGKVAAEGGDVVRVWVDVDGFNIPDWTWKDPCPEGTDWRSRRSETDFKSENKTLKITPAAPAEGAGPVSFDGGTGFAFADHGIENPLLANWVVNYAAADQATFQSEVLTEVWWSAGCRDPLTGRTARTEEGDQYLWEGWVSLVTQETLVPRLYQELEKWLVPPQVTWPDRDREFGWLYVKAPMDFRITPPQGVMLVTSVRDATGAWVDAWVTARPASVMFDPGEPIGPNQPGAAVCSVADATAGYSKEVPGACHYVYQNSSAISPSLEFDTRMSIHWDVTTSSPVFGRHPRFSWANEAIAVAEVQAVVVRR